MRSGEAQRRLAALLEQEGAPAWLTDRTLGTPPAGRGDARDEVLRIAVALIAEIVADQVSPSAEGHPGPRHRLLRPRVRLVVTGTPLAAAATGAAAGLGAEAIGARPRQMLNPPREVAVLAADPATALAEVWACRVRSGQVRSWGGFLATWAGRDRLAPRADAAGLARRWARRVGAENVHVLLDSSQVPGLAAGLTPVRPTLVAAPYRLLVRLNPVLRILLDEARQQPARALVLPLLDAEPGAGIEVPAVHRRWLEDRAAVLQAQLVAGGYALHGDPELLLRGGRADSAPAPRANEVLDLAVRVLLQLAASIREEDQ